MLSCIGNSGHPTVTADYDIGRVGQTLAALPRGGECGLWRTWRTARKDSGEQDEHSKGNAETQEPAFAKATAGKPGLSSVFLFHR